MVNVVSYKKLIEDTPQAMTYQEREDLKILASDLAQTKDADSLRDLLVMIAHWMRQVPEIPFSIYASNWIHADRDVTQKLKDAFPLKGKRMIGDKCSDWNSNRYIPEHHLSRRKT